MLFLLLLPELVKPFSERLKRFVAAFMARYVAAPCSKLLDLLGDTWTVLRYPARYYGVEIILTKLIGCKADDSECGWQQIPPLLLS